AVVVAAEANRYVLVSRYGVADPSDKIQTVVDNVSTSQGERLRLGNYVVTTQNLAVHDVVGDSVSVSLHEQVKSVRPYGVVSPEHLPEAETRTHLVIVASKCAVNCTITNLVVTPTYKIPVGIIAVHVSAPTHEILIRVVAENIVATADDVMVRLVAEFVESATDSVVV